MKKNSLVVKDNVLVNASYNLDLVEQRLILLAVVGARESGQGVNANDPLTIHADSYISHFNVARQTAYQALKDACRNLFERRFSYQESTKKGSLVEITSRWVSQIAYIDETASVQLIFTPAVVPMITALERHFTSYEIEQVSELSSAYAVRLYEILIAWRSTGKTPVFELADFRYKLGDTAIKQINLHTDITAKYEQHKSGRKITGFSFTFKQKNAAKTASSNLKREEITKDQAAKKARPGEDWNTLVKRLTRQYKITGL